MGETRSQLNASNGILVCLVREIWLFKLFAGKKVTAVPATRGKEVTDGEEEGYCACVETEWLCLFQTIGNKMIAYVSPVGDLFQ